MSNASEMTWEQAVETLRGDPDKQEMVRACFYDDPLPDAATRYWRGSEWAALRAYLPKAPGHALDIGSGRGIAAFAFASDGWAVTALEPDASDIVGAGAIRALAGATGTSITVVQEWGERLPFPDQSFDVVHCRAVLHHAHDLAQLCREVGRVLKPNGLFVATREHVVTREEDIPAFQAGHPLHPLYGGENAYRVDDYIDAIVGGGFRIEHVLNPFESDINLFPLTKADLKRQWSARLRLPIGRLLPDALLKWRGASLDAPGRLYSFFARKQ